MDEEFKEDSSIVTIGTPGNGTVKMLAATEDQFTSGGKPYATVLLTKHDLYLILFALKVADRDIENEKAFNITGSDNVAIPDYSAEKPGAEPGTSILNSKE
jgi:hypothetical protein